MQQLGNSLNTPSSRIHDIAGDIGIGLVAGFVGTAAVTLSKALDAKLTGASDGDKPGEAVEKVLEVEAEDHGARTRLSQFAHWSYGTALGGIRGVLDVAGLRGPVATAVHALAVQGAAAVMLPALELAPPASQTPPKELARGLVHHTVYAIAVGLTYEYLNPRRRLPEVLAPRPEALADLITPRAVFDAVTPFVTGGMLAGFAHLARAGRRNAPLLRKAAFELATDLRQGDMKAAGQVVGVGRR